MNTDFQGSVRVRVDLIDVGKRVREVDPDHVAGIAASMREREKATPGRGQLSAIEIRPAADGRYLLTIGAHRLDAVKLNGWDTIVTDIVPCGELEAEQREIEENLRRHDLTPLDRARHLARSQEIYEELHPDAVRGKAGAAARWEQATNLSFTSDQAAKLGISQRDVQRSVARHTKIADAVRLRISGTWIARKGAELDALVRCGGAAMQTDVIDRMLRTDNPAASVAAALQEIRGSNDLAKDPETALFNRLVRTWDIAAPATRQRFLKHLEGLEAKQGQKKAAP